MKGAKYILFLLILMAVGPVMARCIATIDTAWFSQHTACDERGLVDICYTMSSPCRDSVFAIRFQVSTDGGDSWGIRPRAVTYSFGEYGDYVHPGTHCFTWDPLEDMDAWEGSDFMVRVFLQWDILLVDSFYTFEDSRYNVAGNDAYIDPDSLYFVLAQNMAGRNGRLLSVDTFVNDTMGIEFDFKIDPGEGCLFATDSTGGDGLSFLFTPHESPPMTSGPGFGIIGSDGWGFEVDIFNNYCASATDMNGNHVAVSTDSVRCVWAGEDIPHSLVQRNVTYEIADGEWHHADIRIMYPQVRFYLDGYLRIHSYLIYLPAIDTVHIGFFGSSGRCHAGHYIDNILVRRPRFTVTDESEFEASGVLDTRPPAVILACPDPTEAGDIGEFTWIAEDSFPGFGGICSLFVQYPAFTDTLLTMEDHIATALFPSCEPVIATVSVPDSFCNRGRTSCAFTTCDSPAGFVVCGPADGHTSCSGQPVTFGIYDTLCDNMVDTVWATVRMPGPDRHLMTGAPELVTWIVADTTFVTIGGWSASDMESVTVSIDSVRYDNGCTAGRR